MIRIVNIKVLNPQILWKFKVMIYSILDVKKLNIIKERVIELVNDIFNNHEQRLRSIIRTQYRIDAPDTTKLKLAIDQL